MRNAGDLAHLADPGTSGGSPGAGLPCYRSIEPATSRTGSASSTRGSHLRSKENSR
jgi:hypothetical protein